MKKDRQPNPYKSPVQAPFKTQPSGRQNESIAKLEKKAKNIGNDAEKAILAALIPIIGLVFILRLVQWYLLRPKIEGNQQIDRHVRRKFMNGKARLWFGATFWPALMVLMTVFLFFGTQ